MRGEGRIFKRGKYWHLAFYGPGDNGMIEIRESSGSESELAARKLLKKRIREVANHRGGVQAFQGPNQERLTVSDLIDSLEADYRRRGIKSLQRTIMQGKQIREFFGHYRAVAVTSDLVRRYIELRQSDKKKPKNSTINRGLEVLSAAFNLALKEERLARKPHVPHLSETGNARKGFFEAAEHELMIKHLPKPMDDIARFAYVCGWRKEEIRTLRWEYVDRAAKEVRIYDSKNGEGRVLPLVGETLAMFERLWSVRQFKTSSGIALSEFIFHVNGRPVGVWNFEKLWSKARKKAGAAAAGKIFHDYRRTAVRNMIRAGVPQAVAMSISGHRTTSMFTRYNIVSTTDQADALRRQFEYLKGQPVTSNVVEFSRDTDKTRTMD